MSDSEIATALRPKRLGPRGKAFWSAMTKDTAPPADVVVLIVEACHLLDRLERLSTLVDGDANREWARIKLPKSDGGELVLVVNGAMAEARQTEQVLRLTLAQIGKAEPAAEQEGGSAVDELNRRREERARRRAAAGASAAPTS